MKNHSPTQVQYERELNRLISQEIGNIHEVEAFVLANLGTFVDVFSPEETPTARPLGAQSPL